MVAHLPSGKDLTIVKSILDSQNDYRKRITEFMVLKDIDMICGGLSACIFSLT